MWLNKLGSEKVILLSHFLKKTTSGIAIFVCSACAWTVCDMDLRYGCMSSNCIYLVCMFSDLLCVPLCSSLPASALITCVVCYVFVYFIIRPNGPRLYGIFPEFQQNPGVRWIQAMSQTPVHCYVPYSVCAHWIDCVSYFVKLSEGRLVI